MHKLKLKKDLVCLNNTIYTDIFYLLYTYKVRALLRPNLTKTETIGR